MKLKPQFLKTFALIQVLFTSIAVNAQTPEMADAMRANGKIYVVVVVIALIFVGLVIYLVAIDRKVGKLESEIEDLKK